MPGDRGLYSVIWILTIHTDPQNESVLSARVGNMLPACLFVLTACLFVMRLVFQGFRACRSTSATGHAKDVLDSPKSCWGSHHVLSVSVPSCRGLLTDSAFSRLFSTIL